MPWFRPRRKAASPAPAGHALYTRPREVSDPAACVFYHTMDVPGVGLIEGQWDLRGREHDYTGGVQLAGKRVLEVGTASGHLCFWMEGQGAEVVAFDLSDGFDWDVVPFAQTDVEEFQAGRRRDIGMLNDGYWLAHRAFGSKARVVYGTVYAIPVAIGAVDYALLGSVLLHVRDPFLALQQASRLTREAVVVTELVPFVGGGESMWFRPDFRTLEPRETWWWLPPEVIVAFLGVLGFEDSTVTYHAQNSQWGELNMYTVVARRTQPFQEP